MHTSPIHKEESKNLFKNLKVLEIITFGEQSLELFFTSLDVEQLGVFCIMNFHLVADLTHFS